MKYFDRKRIKIEKKDTVPCKSIQTPNLCYKVKSGNNNFKPPSRGSFLEA